MKKGDCFAIAGVLLLAAVIFALTLFPRSSGGAVTVEIYRDGELIYSAPITKNAVVPVEGDYTNVVTIENGEVWMSDTDCPGGDCVLSGVKTRAGESVFCLPNRVEVRLTGSDLDMIAG